MLHAQANIANRHYTISVLPVVTMLMEQLNSVCAPGEIHELDVAQEVQGEFVHYLYGSSEFGYMFQDNFLQDVVDGQPVTPQHMQFIIQQTHQFFDNIVKRTIGTITAHEIQVPSWIGPTDLVLETIPASQTPNPTPEMWYADHNPDQYY